MSVEVDIRNGLPSLSIVGALDSQTQRVANELLRRDRLPPKRVTINIADFFVATIAEIADAVERTYWGRTIAEEVAWLAEAHSLGAEAGRTAASWTCDGNEPDDRPAKLLAMLDVGDPAVYDLLPDAPNLSGQWADSLTPLRLAIEIMGDERDPDPMIDELCNAWEEGVSETFESACAEELRKRLTPPHG